MSSYSRAYPMSYSRRQKKKHGKALKIFLTILIVIVVALVVLFALNFNTIMLFFGKGSIKVKEIPQIKTSITGTGMFTGVKETTGTNGETVLTSVSKDNAVTLKITQQKDGKESIATQIDTKKLDTSGINTTDLLHGNPAAIQAAKKLADKYIGTIVDPSDVTGMEAYLASNLLGQYKSNPDDMSISHTFGDTSLNLTGDTSTGIVNINIKQ